MKRPNFPLLRASLRHLLALAQEDNFSFVSYRMPHSSAPFSLLSKTPLQHLTLLEAQQSPTPLQAFVFSPFRSLSCFHPPTVPNPNNFLSTPFFFLTPHYFYSHARSAPLALANNKKQLLKKKILATSFPLPVWKQQLKKLFRKLPDSTTQSTTKAQFQAGVEAILSQIKQQRLKKAVLSKVKTLAFKKNLPDPVELFLALLVAFPQALVALIWLPRFGFWLTASPEELVSLSGAGLFKTVALAGTIALKEKKPTLENVSWGEKEIEEQALVSRYLVDCFKALRLRQYEEKGPQTTLAGAVAHLRSEFSVDTKRYYGKKLFWDMLGLLHPTSAVCGVPKLSARRCLAQHERHSREFYSGFLGPLQLAEENALFVNLRCLKLASNKAVFYSGAGITHASKPAAEWKETEAKLQPLPQLFKACFHTSP